MLVELVDEVALYGLKCRIHAIEHQVVPVGGEAHELAERGWVVLDQGEYDISIKWVIVAAKLDYSLWLHLNLLPLVVRVSQVISSDVLMLWVGLYRRVHDLLSWLKIA